MDSSDDRARRARALERAKGDFVVEPILSLGEVAPTHAPDSSPVDLLRAAAGLSRRAWLIAGRDLPPEGRAHRADAPGELFVIDESGRPTG